MFDIVGNIMAYEAGELGTVETVKLFSHLVSTGTAWSLQGSYGRAAAHLIDIGVLRQDGEIDHSRLEEVLEDA